MHVDSPWKGEHPCRKRASHPEREPASLAFLEPLPATTECVGFLTETRNSPRIAPFALLRSNQRRSGFASSRRIRPAPASLAVPLLTAT